MPRIIIGACPACGAVLKAPAHALHPVMPYTCRCGWHGKVQVDPLLVARAGELRSRRLSARERHAAWRRRRRLRAGAILLGVLAAACAVLGALSAADLALRYCALGAILAGGAAFAWRRRWF